MIVNRTYNIPIKRKLAPFEKEVNEPLLTNISSFSPDTNPNIFAVTHKTSYSYTSKVTYSKHLFRLQPSFDISQTVLHYNFTVSVNNGNVTNFTGSFGNHASFLEIREPYTDLDITSESIVVVHELPKNMDLLHQPRTMPLIWMPWDRIMMQAYLQTPELPESELFELAEYAMTFVRRNHNDVFAVLNDINATIYREYIYMPGETSLNTTAYQVYLSRTGVCQDFAMLLICLARLLGLPARYCVGYLYTFSDYENKVQSDATHAWVEIYFPYMGWLGLDPTNGCLVEKNHIRVACGRYYNDAAPTSGTIFEAGPQTRESLSASVQVLKLNE